MERQRVFVGLSGGVDSAVSAALLKEQGFDVTGVFIKIWQPEFIECTWKEDRLDAMRVAVALGIPFKEVDLSPEYKKSVVEEMVAEYARGATPNPDILCNRRVKFGAFAKWAFEQGAEKIATGHYARIRGKKGGRFELLRGVEAGKDQSYFLCRLSQDDLARALFPVGNYPKARVRGLAKRFRLPVADKPDSQGLCFVGEVSMKDFLARFLPLAEGAVLDGEGKRVGTHEGAALYTVGQRHGFRVEGEATAAGPYYVVSVDVRSNTLHVSSRKSDACRIKAVLAEEHWIGDASSLPKKFDIQARYHETPVKAVLSREAGVLTASFDAPHLASPGQTIALYQGDVLEGSATIASS